MPKDCCKKMWASVPDDEPVFTIRGKDKLAARTVAFWLEKARSAGVNAEKLNAAQRHLDDIVNFQSEHPERTKMPD